MQQERLRVQRRHQQQVREQMRQQPVRVQQQVRERVQVQVPGFLLCHKRPKRRPSERPRGVIF